MDHNADDEEREDAMSITDDVQRRSAHIHWPCDVNPDRADLFAHNDIVVNAPADVIWNHLVRASAWPSWYSNASDVVVNAPNGILGPGVTFDWITFGASIHSTVHEIEHERARPQSSSFGIWRVFRESIEDSQAPAAQRTVAEATAGHRTSNDMLGA